MAVPICNFEWHIDWRTLAGILPYTEKELRVHWRSYKILTLDDATFAQKVYAATPSIVIS